MIKQCQQSTQDYPRGIDNSITIQNPAESKWLFCKEALGNNPKGGGYLQAAAHLPLISALRRCRIHRGTKISSSRRQTSTYTAYPALLMIEGKMMDPKAEPQREQISRPRSPLKPPRKRKRIVISCTECHRRKQKVRG